MHENNMRLTLEQCLELAPALRALGFVWLEEPVEAGSASGHTPGERRTPPGAAAAPSLHREKLPAGEPWAARIGR